MDETGTPASHGDDLEKALRVFEAKLSESAVGGTRHAQPDDDDDHLHELRMVVIRRAEALPTAVWPRPACSHCAGEREVKALQARYPEGNDAPEFDAGRRTCPKCWGTGLTLNHE